MRRRCSERNGQGTELRIEPLILRLDDGAGATLSYMSSKGCAIGRGQIFCAQGQLFRPGHTGNDMDTIPNVGWCPRASSYPD